MRASPLFFPFIYFVTNFSDAMRVALTMLSLCFHTTNESHQVSLGSTPRHLFSRSPSLVLVCLSTNQPNISCVKLSLHPLFLNFLSKKCQFHSGFYLPISCKKKTLDKGSVMLSALAVWTLDTETEIDSLPNYRRLSAVAPQNSIIHHLAIIEICICKIFLSVRSQAKTRCTGPY